MGVGRAKESSWKAVSQVQRLGVPVRVWHLGMKQRVCLTSSGLSLGIRTPGAFPALSKARGMIWREKNEEFHDISFPGDNGKWRGRGLLLGMVSGV